MNLSHTQKWSSMREEARYTLFLSSWMCFVDVLVLRGKQANRPPAKCRCVLRADSGSFLPMLPNLRDFFV